MVRIQTSSRLHFGLLSLTPPGDLWPDHGGTPLLQSRRFGGVGLMIERPGIRLRVEPAREWSAAGPLAERCLTFARRFAASVTSPGTPCHLVVEEVSPEHAGLGTGTQLGLAVGCCLKHEWGLPMSVAEVARRIGRGERSALGIWGFALGGFLVEGGQTIPDTLSPLLFRRSFPASWRVVLVRPKTVTGIHGTEERSVMARLAMPVTTTDALCRLVLLGMLPALVDEDVNAFGDALFDFNARAGEIFAPAQGGIYASPAVAELVAFIRSLGIRGVGQSSWGPTVFAIVGSDEAASDLVCALAAKRIDSHDVIVTRAANRPADVEA